MGIKFQPKIIIGSLFGMIASIIGFIAIFFPSLFNLETEKIPDNFEIELSSEDSFLKLNDYILKFNPEKGEEPKIFRFTATVCNDEDSLIGIDYSDSDKSYYRIGLYHDKEAKDNHLTRGDFITIEGKPAILKDYRNYEIGDLCKGVQGNGGTEIGGYFLYQDGNIRAVYTYIDLKSIPLEQVRLKSY